MDNFLHIFGLILLSAGTITTFLLDNPAAWEEWGKWRCRLFDHGNCMMFRTRECSTGTDCGAGALTVGTCNQSVCPDKVKLEQSGQCSGYVSGGKPCADVPSSCDIITNQFHPICQDNHVSYDICPKACGCCEEMPHWLEWSAWTCHLAPNHTCEMHRTRNCSTGSLNDCVGKSAMKTNCSNTVCPETINLTKQVDCSAVGTLATKCVDGPGCSAFKTEFLLNILCSDPTTVAECPITCGCCACKGCGNGAVPSRLADDGSIYRHYLGLVVNGRWTDWQDWSKCTHSCSGGTRTRVRTCMNPAPSPGGQYCAGDGNMTENCNSLACPEWSQWLYSTCSVSCGNGTKTRTRLCSSGNDLDCGPGKGWETVVCQERPCQINGRWADWQEWSKCSQSCAGGFRTRVRTCTDPPPAYGGKDCTGNRTMTEDCQITTCPEWSQWLYSACTVSCGNGERTRLRLCSSGNDLDCGPGNGWETVVCHEGPCPHT